MKIMQKNNQHSCCGHDEDSHKKSNENHSEAHDGHDHNHDIGDASLWIIFLPAVVSFILLATAIVFDNFDTILVSRICESDLVHNCLYSRRIARFERIN